MLASLLLLTAVNPTVSVDTAALPLRRMLERASPVGIRLACEDTIASDLVAVRATKVPLDAFMSRVAEATIGTWKEVEGGYRLERAGAKWSAIEKEEAKRRIDLMREAIVRVAEPTTKNPQFTAATAKELGEAMREASTKLATQGTSVTIDWGALQGRSPADRLMARMLMSIDPADLASMVEGERRIWSSRPTRLQRPMGPGAAQALNQFLDESKVWLANRPTTVDDDGLSMMGMHANWGGTSTPPAKALLIANSWSTHGFINLELKLLDDKGRELMSSGTAFAAGVDLPSKEDKTPAPLQGEARIEWSKDTLVVRGLKSRISQEMPTDFRKMFLNPIDSDPYHLAAVELARVLAGERPFVLALNDLMISSFDSIPANSAASSARWLLGRTGQVEIADQDGWFVMTPRNPVAGKAYSLNRLTFGAMLAEMEQRGGPSLDHLLVLSRSMACHSPVLMPWVRALFPETASVSTMGSWDVLRFYDALRPSLGAAETESLIVGRLAEGPRNRLAHLVYFSVFGQIMSFTSMQTTPDAMMDENGTTNEPTEVWPAGLPGELQLNVERQKGVVLAGIGSDLDPMDPQELGAQLAMRERPDVFPWVTEFPFPAKFAVLNRLSVNLSLALNPDEWLSMFQLSDLTRTDSRSYTVGTLPPDIFKKVEEARAEARKAHSGIGTASGTGGNIPPLKTP